MSTVANPEVLPRLEVERFWPVSGPHWSNLSPEHQVQAGDSIWDRITPNGTTVDKRPKSLKPDEKAAMKRRKVLGQAVSNGVADLWCTEETIAKFSEVTEGLEALEWDDLVSSVSGLMGQAQERRQALVAQRVTELSRVLDRETVTLGVLMCEIEGPDKLMGRLGGFFVRSAESDDHDDLSLSQLGVAMISTDGHVGQSPEGYEANGLYLQSSLKLVQQ